MLGRRSMRALGLALAVFAGCAQPPTPLIVVVDTDLAIPSALDRVEITVVGPDGITMETERIMLSGPSSLPLTLGVSPSGERLGPIDITAIGRVDGTLVVTREHTVTLLRGETR